MLRILHGTLLQIKLVMKNIFRIAALLIIFFSLSSMNEKEKGFHVVIEQNGKLIEPKNGVVSIDKSEFNIIFEFNNPMGLLINGSFKKKTYKLASKGKHKSNLPGFQSTGMAEGLLNPGKEIFISDDAPNYWFYDDDKKNRFNSIEKVDGKLFCRRIIKNLYDVDTKATTIVENVEQPLYLVFISYKYVDKEEVEIKREWIKINWKK